jgi:protocatechuate 3,4-dioxygenase beta subunit
MSRSCGTAFLVVAFITGAADIRADDRPGGQSPATGAITGRVVDLEGRPIERAKVWGMPYLHTLGATRTGADGRFRLEPLKADKPVAVWADAAGFARQRREGLHVFAGRDHDIGTITMLPGTCIRGRAVDAGGRPVAGARVKVEDYRFILGHTITSDQTVWSLKSDAEGRFLTAPLPAGDAHFLISSPGKVRTFVLRKAEPGVEKADLGDVTLADEVPIRGSVIDQDGKPAPGVEVYADYDHENAVKTDQDGRFTVKGAGKDAKQLILRSNNYFAPKPFDLGPDRNDLKLTVTRAYEIHGAAVDAETGKPVPIDTVRLCIVARDPDGSFVLMG